METQVHETGLIQVESFKQIIDTAPGVLTLNETSAVKASAAGEYLLQQIASSGMNDDLDKEANDLLVKIRKTYDLMNERRKPITSLFDSVKKVFTEFEGRIDPKGKDNVYARIQLHRNNWAAAKAQEQKKREEEARRKAAYEQERITIKSDIELKLKQHFLSYVEAQQKVLVNLFEGIQLDTFDPSAQLILKFSEAYPFSHFENFIPQVYKVYLTDEEVRNILTNAKLGKFDTFAREFSETIKGLKEIFTDKLPSKRNELAAIANANAEEKKRLEAEAEARRKAEQERIEKESAEKAAAAAAQAETNKQVETANSLFDMQAGMVGPDSTAQVREGFEITVTNPAGYLQIVAFYFEKEGLKEGIDKLEKKTLGSMKKFVEDYAKKTGEKITNPYLVYNEKFTAVNKK